MACRFADLVEIAKVTKTLVYKTPHQRGTALLILAGVV